MLYRFDPLMIQDLEVVLNRVCQLNGESLRRIENYLNVVRTILITRANPQRGLLLDGLREFVSGRSHESRVEQIRAILLKRGSQILPGLQIIANRGCSGLLRQWPGTLQIRWFDAHRSLSGPDRWGSRS